MDTELGQRGTIAQGYAAMFLLLLMMMATDLIEFGMKGDFAGLNSDPGERGLWLLVVLAVLNVAGQLSARLVVRPLARWALAVATVLYTLFFAGHQASHLLAGAGFDLHFALDLAHHAAGIAASVAAYRLARSGHDEPVTKAAHSVMAASASGQSKSG